MCNKRKTGEEDNAPSARITVGCPVSAVYERFTRQNNLNQFLSASYCAEVQEKFPLAVCQF